MYVRALPRKQDLERGLMLTSPKCSPRKETPLALIMTSTIATCRSAPCLKVLTGLVCRALNAWEVMFEDECWPIQVRVLCDPLMETNTVRTPVHGCQKRFGPRRSRLQLPASRALRQGTCDPWPPPPPTNAQQHGTRTTCLRQAHTPSPAWPRTCAHACCVPADGFGALAWGTFDWC